MIPLRQLFLAGCGLAICLSGGCGSGSSGPSARQGPPHHPVSIPSPNVRVEPTSPSVLPTGVVLSPAARTYLWECEHGGNLLSQNGFSSLSKALLSGKAEQVRAFLAEDFAAAVPKVAPRSIWSGDDVEVRRTDDPGAVPEPISREAFAEWLTSPTAELLPTKRATNFELLSYSPTERSEIDGPWRGRARLRLYGQTAESQPIEWLCRFTFTTLPARAETFAARGWLLSCEVEEIETRRSSRLLMQEVAAASGFPVDEFFDNWRDEKEHRLITTGGVYLCDYNRDGYTDVLLTEERGERNPRFYQGLPGGQFREVTHRVGIPNAPGVTQALFADLDNDGWEDLIFLGLAVFVNRQGKLFQNVTAHSNLSQLVQEKGLGGVSGAVVADYDRDGLIDVYVTRADTREHKAGSWIDGRSGNDRGNQLLHNLGNGQFEDVTEISATSGDRRSAFTAAWLDANNDGWPDLYVIHEFGAGQLLLNQRDGRFLPQRLGDASEDFGSMGLAVGDIDNDGGVDLYISNMYSKAGNRVMDNLPPAVFDAETMFKLRRMVSGSELRVQMSEGTFQPIAKQAGVNAVGWSWGTALADLNNDGLLDIHSMAGFMSYDRAKPDG